MAYTSEENLKIREGESNLGCYQFNTKVAKHYFCKTCGIYVFHNTRSLPGKVGVNIGCIEGINPFEIEVELINGAAK